MFVVFPHAVCRSVSADYLAEDAVFHTDVCSIRSAGVWCQGALTRRHGESTTVLTVPDVPAGLVKRITYMEQLFSLASAAMAGDPVAIVSLLGMGSTALFALWMTIEVIKGATSAQVDKKV